MMLTRRARMAGLATLMLAVAACAGKTPSIQTGEDAEVIRGSLNRVDNARVDLAYVDPSVDYSRYRSVRLLPLDLEHVDIVQPNTNSVLNRFDKEWELTAADREQILAAYDEIMRRELGATGTFSISEETAADVLDIEAMLTRIAPNAPKDDISSRSTARSIVYTQGAGSISIAMALRDSASGEVLALLKDTRDGQTSAWGINDRVRNMAEVRRIFGLWATRLRRGLEALREREAHTG